MELPNIWGEGQIFVYSALDGESFFSDDFCGNLTKESIGIKFYLKEKRTIILNDTLENVSFDIVSSDYISFNSPSNTGNILFVKNHLLIGTCTNNSYPKIKSNCNVKKVEDIYVDYKNDEFVCMIKKDNLFAISFAHDLKRAIQLVQSGLHYDIEEEIAKKTKIYKEHPYDDETYAKLYSKCISVMKSQLYSKEDKFETIWSTPDRLPHRKMWLWDSVFHAIGHRHLDVEVAKNLIRSIFTLQDKDGFIPHMSGVNIKSSITQPPVIAYGAYKVYEVSNDLAFLKEIYEKNKPFLAWCHNNRRLSDLYLYTWNTTNNPLCKCDESGMDNSSRFDIHEPLYAIDFACFMANESIYMAKIAKLLNKEEDEKYYIDLYNHIKNDINTHLYSKEDGFYFDYNISKKCFHKVYSVAHFLPLLCNVPSKEQAIKLVEALNDDKLFKTEFMIPSIARNHETYGTDMWRGPVWINFNYLVAEGLASYGYNDLSNKIKDETLKYVNEWYLKTGTIFEFYDSEKKKAPYQLNRKGPPLGTYDFEVKIQVIRDYGWSTTLVFDLLNERR